MTEIPEHLLQRSRERRSAMGGGDAGGGSGSTAGGDGESTSESAAPVKAAATPAPAAATAPATPEPVVEKPAPPYVQAYLRRRRIPYWAMPVLAAIPLWAYIYQGTLEPPPGGPGFEEEGSALYAEKCASCHGGGGGGGVGPAFTEGNIYATWPKFEDHFQWVRLGTNGWPETTYGANNKPVGGVGNMPAFDQTSLSDAELLYVLYHERHALGGENPDAADEERLLAAIELAEANPEATLEELLAQMPAEG